MNRKRNGHWGVRGLAAMGVLLVMAATLAACGAERKMARVEKQMAQAPRAEEIPPPEKLMKKAVVVVVDRSGSIFVHGEPLGADEDLAMAIRKAYTKKRTQWPLTVYIDPAQKEALYQPVLEAASEVRPGLVNVITYSVDYTAEDMG